MDQEGQQRVWEVLDPVRRNNFEVFPPLKDGEVRRFIAVGDGVGLSAQVVQNALDAAGLMYHEGEPIPEGQSGPVLKYQGTTVSPRYVTFHEFEDVASGPAQPPISGTRRA